MRDDRLKWAPVPDPLEAISGEAVSLAPCHVGRQYLVSGVSIATQDAFVGGWPTVITGEDYTLRIARDQVLQVGCTSRTTGWDAETSHALSDMTDGFEVFEVTGARAIDVLQRGAELDLNHSSRSVARDLWGMRVLLYRHGSEETFRLHIERSHAHALYQALRSSLLQAR